MKHLGELPQVRQMTHEKRLAGKALLPREKRESVAREREGF